MQITPLRGPRGLFDAEAVRAALRVKRRHSPPQTLLEVEQTANIGGGAVWPLDQLNAVADVARRLGTSSAAVALAWLRSRRQSVVPIIGALRVAHLEDNLAGADLVLDDEHRRALDDVSSPTLNYPAPMHGAQRTMLQFAGATVDGIPSTVYPPLLASAQRY